MKAASRVLLNALSSYGALGFYVLINVLIVPYVIRYLGKELFGLVALAQSLQVLVALVASGMAQAIGRYFALTHAVDDRAGLQRYYTNAATITIGILTPLVIVLTGAVILYVVPICDIPSGQTRALVHLLVLFSGFSIARIWSTPYMAICAAVQRFYLEHLSLLLGQSAFALIILILLPLRPSLVSYGVAYLFSSVLRLIAIYFIGKRIFPYCRFRFALVSLRTILKIFSVSTQAFLPAVSSSVYTQVNQVMVNCFLGPLYNTYLALCLVWQAVVWQIMNAIGSVIAPQITTYQAHDQWDRIRDLLCRVTKYSALIGFPVSAVLALLREPIFDVWLGEGYEASTSIMPWFALAFGFLASQIPPAQMLIALGKFRFPSVMAPIFAACNLTAVLVLVGGYGCGLRSVAIVFFVCASVRLGIIQTWYLARQCAIPWSSYIRKAYLQPVLALVPAVVVLVVSLELVVHWRLWHIAMVLVVAGLVYVPCSWFIALDRWDRDLARSYAVTLRGKVVGR